MDARPFDGYYIDARNLSLEDREYIHKQLRLHAFVYNEVIGLQEFIFYMEKEYLELLQLPPYVQLTPIPPHLLH